MFYLKLIIIFIFQVSYISMLDMCSKAYGCERNLTFVHNPVQSVPYYKDDWPRDCHFNTDQVCLSSTFEIYNWTMDLARVVGDDYLLSIAKNLFRYNIDVVEDGVIQANDDASPCVYVIGWIPPIILEEEYPVSDVYLFTLKLARIVGDDYVMNGLVDMLEKETVNVDID